MAGALKRRHEHGDFRLGHRLGLYIHRAARTLPVR
jgi:hypothetical protein